MRTSDRFFFLFLLLLSEQNVLGLVSSDNAQLTRSLLQQALVSNAGKLTLSPEIVIPEPSDPTAILLQSTAIQSLSERIRREAKANAAFISGSVTSVQTFAREQETARGNMPGPVPVVFCGSIAKTEDLDEEEILQELAESGVAGVLVSATDDDFVGKCNRMIDVGMQPIPEVQTTAGVDCAAVVDDLCSKLGFDPTSILLTMEQPALEEDAVEADLLEVELPIVAKELQKRVPILGSVIAVAGRGRIGQETGRFKEAGFSGGVLRADCVPGFRMNPDLDAVSQFWVACIGNLKSLKSKAFSFRSKNNMEKDLAKEWAKYSLDVVESGAIGSAGHEGEAPEVDVANGDYVGF